MRHLLLVSFLAFTIGLIFYFFPALDIYISSWFFDKYLGFCNTDCHREKGNITLTMWDYIANPVIPAIFIFGILCNVIYLYIKTQSFHYRYYLPTLYLIASIIIGPLITVSTMKEVFNRARPDQILEFNGKKQFTPAFVLSDQCAQNCSFVSGHAAAAFMLFSLAFLISEKKKRNYFMVSIIMLGLFVGLGRVSFGRHFASDVIFAGFFVYVTTYITAILFRLESVRGKQNAKRED